MTNAVPTTHRISEFYHWHKEGVLELKPPFQRNPVWSPKNRSYLIDTILHNDPVPEVFIQVETDSQGSTKYSVVDGQQRIRSILDYIEGTYSILESESEDFGGKKFKDLPSDRKKDFWDYQIVTRELKTSDENEVKAIFKRMNKYVTPLNSQELRNATYRGHFIELATQLSGDDYWTENKIVSANDVRRMVDIEYISEILIAMLHGVQTKDQDAIDGFYKMYDDQFAEKEKIRKEFISVRNKLEEIMGDLRPTRWNNKPEFYSLFLAFNELIREYSIPSARYDAIRDALCKFASEVDNAIHSSDRGASHSNQQIVDFVSATISQTTDKEKRLRRIRIIRELVIPFLVAKDPRREFNEEERRIAWAITNDKSCGVCGEKVSNWDDYHLDHKIPHSKGGKTELQNAQITHKKCNQSKSDR
jgi:5-methylcytosine-specific restriction endonuclease McrA